LGAGIEIVADRGHKHRSQLVYTTARRRDIGLEVADRGRLRPEVLAAFQNAQS
jgi:hypothetical protein